MQKNDAKTNPALAGIEKSEPASTEPRDLDEFVRQQVEVVMRNLTAEPLVPKEPSETGL